MSDQLTDLYNKFRDAQPGTPEFHQYWEELLAVMIPEKSGKKDDSQVVGKQSVERLVHFQCGSCRKWWSIGDAPADPEKWYCPWCGILQSCSGL